MVARQADEQLRECGERMEEEDWTALGQALLPDVRGASSANACNVCMLGLLSGIQINLHILI